MREYAYPMARSTFGEGESAVLASAANWSRHTMGTRVAEFERAFAERVGAKHAVMVNSGSSANLIAVDAMLRRSGGVEAPWKRGDRIIVPALAWPTTVWPLAQLGLVPVLADISLDNLGLTERSAWDAAGQVGGVAGTFLIVPLGNPLAEISEQSIPGPGVYDCCESFGAVQGPWHDMGTFSFYFSHHISTIEGGMVVTDDDALRDDLVSLRSHGWIRDRKDRTRIANEYPELDENFLFYTGGYNVRPTEIAGALGIVQLEGVAENIRKRRIVAHEAWACCPSWMRVVGVDRTGNADADHSWMMIPFLLQPDAPLSLREVRRRLEESGVETRPIIAGNIARHPAAKQFRIETPVPLPNADYVMRNGFMVGCHEPCEPLRAALRSLCRV